MKKEIDEEEYLVLVSFSCYFYSVCTLLDFFTSFSFFQLLLLPDIANEISGEVLVSFSCYFVATLKPLRYITF